jgi:thermostable 8-oxoguanine DNA glycosylase
VRGPSDSSVPQRRVVKASDFKGELADFLIGYNYQVFLTKKLDDLASLKLTPKLVNEIVLWKVNRFVLLQKDLLDRLNALRTLKAGAHGEARPVIDSLLRIRGVDLPMASTLLRFRNSKVFQIIDKHAYRALYGENYPPYIRSPEQKIDVYFSYLERLRSLCKQKRLRFETADRVLYVFDKKKNGKL